MFNKAEIQDTHGNSGRSEIQEIQEIQDTHKMNLWVS